MSNQPPNQTNIHGDINTEGGLVITGQVHTGGGPFVAGDYRATKGPPPAVTDKPTADIFWLTAARTDELAQLAEWYETAISDRQGGEPRAVILTGAAGMGKRELIQRWCVDLAEAAPKPLIAQTTHLPAHYDETQQESWYVAHHRWGQAWATYAQRLRTRYSTNAEALGGRAWLALMAQIVDQSERARTELLNSQPPPTEPDADTLRQLMSEPLTHAARVDCPLVLVIDHVELAATALQMLLHTWQKMLYNLPVLMVLIVDTPHPLHGKTDSGQSSEWLTWLRERSAPHGPYSDRTLHLWALRSNQIGGMLTPDSMEMADELQSLTEGVPDLLRELLKHWEAQGLAEREDDRWRLETDSLTTFSGTLYQRLIENPLRQCAKRAQEFGYDVTWETLLEWLDHAVWEGDTFTDESVAHAVGMHGDNLEIFQDILDEVLTQPLPGPPLAASLGEGDSLLVELEETAVLPTAEIERRERHMALYQFNLPLLSQVLLHRQNERERMQYGTAAIQGLINAYRPLERQIAPLLIQIAMTLGRFEDAERFQRLIAPPEDLERAQGTLAVLQTLATDRFGQLYFVKEVINFFHTYHRKIHPHVFIPILTDALAQAQSMKDSGLEGHLQYHIGDIYSDLGEKQDALIIYTESLPLLSVVGDIYGEGRTISNMGDIYSDLGEKQKALTLYNEALPLQHKVGDISGEAGTLTNMGSVYLDLGEKQKALALYNEALCLQHKVGDISGEAATFTNMGAVYFTLGEKQKALALYNEALPLSRKVGNISGEAITLINMANVYSTLEERRKALEFLNEALPLLRKVGNISKEAIALTNMGCIYSDLGEKQKALALYNEALPLRRKVGDISGEANTLTNMGSVYSDLGEKQKARELFNQALPLFERAGSPGAEIVHQRLARIDKQEEQPTE